MLQGKSVMLGVSGGIAAYKAIEVASRLKKAGAQVYTVMTEHASRFISPVNFETITGNPVALSMFDASCYQEVTHIALGKKCDFAILAPATYNLIGKIANGIADDMLSSVMAAWHKPVLICPAMNTNMLNHPACVSNLERLRSFGFFIMPSESGVLACGDMGSGRLPEPEAIVSEAIRLFGAEQDYSGKTVLITAGATEETIDGVRFLSNYSSGKMGIALAERVIARGGKVILVAGRVSVKLPECECIRVVSTEDMYQAVLSALPRADIIIKAAAPADYRPKTVSANKIKSEAFSLELEKTPDIAKAVGERKGDKILAVFSAETERLTEFASKKRISKNADLVIANDVTEPGAGFGTDTNRVTLIDASGAVEQTALLPKAEIADIILDKIRSLR